jgi:hypothetical protein
MTPVPWGGSRFEWLNRSVVLITGLAGTGRSRAFLAEPIAYRFVIGGFQTMEMGGGRGVLLWILGVPIASSFCWRRSGTIRND